jgi:primosomal protein N' (replication factor Y)
VERVEEEARQLFPQARIAVFSSDTVFDAREAKRLVEAMAEGEIDILVATQAAAKGHNFPRLTLVGVVDADLGLRGGDLRAAERTFQLLAQATGRAGRRDRPGKALLQTYAPEHSVMQALQAQDRDAFVAAEMEERELAKLPPFGRLAAVIASGPDAAQLDAFMRDMAQAAPNAEGVEVYACGSTPTWAEVRAFSCSGVRAATWMVVSAAMWVVVSAGICAGVRPATWLVVNAVRTSSGRTRIWVGVRPEIWVELTYWMSIADS